VLSGAANSNQLKENLKALNFNFLEEELLELNKINTSIENYWEERSQLYWN
jgi:aryl-alcohol dehydrogenase-like predicted oxidoreductase